MAEMRLRPTFTIKAAFPVARTHSGTSGPLPSRTDNKANASRASCCSLDLSSIISEADPLDGAVVPLRGGAHVLGNHVRRLVTAVAADLPLWGAIERRRGDEAGTQAVTADRHAQLLRLALHGSGGERMGMNPLLDHAGR